MPHIKQPKVKEPLWKDWDYLAQKKGVRHTVYSVNGDQYTGEWLDNKKDGKYNFLFIDLFIQFDYILFGFSDSLKHGTDLMMCLYVCISNFLNVHSALTTLYSFLLYFSFIIHFLNKL